ERRRLAGVDTRVVEAGPPRAPEAVVFVHGHPGSADDWGRFVQAAAQAGAIPAAAFDLPRLGEAIPPHGLPPHRGGYSSWLGRALAELGIERVHLVIHDFGGPIGLAWAESVPGRLASVTLIDTGVLPGYRWHRLARVWRTPVVGEVFQAMATRRLFRTL